MPKTFIKKTGGWTEIKSIFVKKTTGWAEVKNVFLKKTTGWVKVFTKLSLPDTTTAPSIRTTNTGSGTIYDGPVATSPQYLNADLFGKDGVYTNYTSIFGRKFTRGSTSSATTRTTIVNDDRFTSAGGVTTAMRTACDGQFLFYELTVQNGSSANEIYPISPAIKMIKRAPTTTDFQWTQAEQVGTQLSLNYVYENYYYNSIDPDLSYIKWWRNTIDEPGGTLIKSETVTATTTGTPNSTSRSGTSYYTPTSADIGYYVVAETTAVNSFTVHNAYGDNYTVASFSTVIIGSALTFSNVAVKDYYDKNGLDNRENWPTGTLNQYTGQISGWDSNTVLRIRYRVYNYNTGLYWKPSTGTQTTASSAWDSWNSDGSGNGYISNVSVSGGVATFYDYFDLSSDFFNGGGGIPATWWLEVELSATRGLGRTYYVNPYETFYISKRIDPTVSVSPSTVGTNTNVTISGTFAGFPASPSTNAYPRQYIIYYGDGNNSGYLPAGEWAYGTLNPTYSNTWSYSNTGTYTVTVRPVPYGEDATATVTVANLPTNTVAPTLTTDTGNFSAGSTITLNAGTWSNASSYSYEILYSSTTPVDTGSSATKTLVNTNQYVITNADATNPSYYFRGRVTGYSGSGQTGNSAIAVTTTSSRSNINPTTTISVGTATSNGFTISGTAGPLSGFGSTYANITSIQIFNSSQSLISTITTGLPTVNGTTGAWSYVWTGGSGSTTYYAKATVAATDTAQTTFTTGFSSAIATVGVPSQISAPTARATNTFSTSVVKYLDSITWSSGTYSNASSVSSVLLYSTNTSNLVAPGGNTSSSFRTANPYTLSTVDGSPPAYIFAVRDTVLGINGITYYFYSNQITSALADGISFSYGTATSTSGGWTASINSAAQSGASYSYVSATAGSGSVNSSTGAVTATGLSSNQSSTITVQKSVSGYNNITSTASGQSGIVATTPSAPTNLSVDNITFTSARINWNAPANNGGATITGYEVNRDGGGFFSVGNVLNYTYTLTGGTYSIGVRAVNSAGSGTAAYISVTIPSFTVPTCVAPSLQFQRTSTAIRWYCDYPTPSGDYSYIIGMNWQLSTTASTTGLLNSGTRSYPGAGTYPYSAGGTIWAFRMGSTDGDISYSASARYGRARVAMMGTNGTTYYGTWSSWI